MSRKLRSIREKKTKANHIVDDLGMKAKAGN